MSIKYTAIRAAFELLWLTRAAHLQRMLTQSRGVIFTLHRVLPEPPAPFSPNAILQVTPDFLDYVIERVRELDCDIVSIDEAIDRLAARERGRRFVVLTFDDGYRDNLQYALPILRKHQAPFTVYVPTAFVDGIGQLWWQAIEDIIARQDAIAINHGDQNEYLDTRTVAQKNAAFRQVYWRMRTQPEEERLKFLAEFTSAYGYDLDRQCQDLIMNWQELALFNAEPLCTIGAHTVNHYELSKLPEAQARAEIAQCVDVIEAQFGIRPAHLSYPLGGPRSCGPREFAMAREMGFRTGVTTRPGALYPHYLDHLTNLPRISLNGYFQKKRYVEVFVGGGLVSTRFSGLASSNSG